MNFFPSGVGQERGTLGSSDSEADAPIQAKRGELGLPNGSLHTSHKPGKRKRREEERSKEREGSPVKKSKKHRTPEEIKRKEEKKARKQKRAEKKG